MNKVVANSTTLFLFMFKRHHWYVLSLIIMICNFEAEILSQSERVLWTNQSLISCFSYRLKYVVVVLLGGRSYQVCQHRRAFETIIGKIVQLPNKSSMFQSMRDAVGVFFMNFLE